MLVVDLCAGAGGLSRGFEDAGFSVAIAVELNRHAASTYRANFPTTDLLQEDLRDVAVDRICRKVTEYRRPIGALVAGLPCQGFSESNRRTRKAGNPRNQLYREFLRLLQGLRPRWFVIENVAGIATLDSGAFLARVLRSFRGAGYSVKWQVLGATDFGIPQVRRRAFLVGNRVGADFAFPAVAEDAKVVTVRDALADLPILRNGSSRDVRRYRQPYEAASVYAQQLRRPGTDEVTGNSVSRNTDRVISRYRHIQPGSNWTSIPRRLMRNYSDLEACHTGIYYRMAWDEPSKVIGNFRKNMLIHPSQQRGLSVREASRLQSFPDDHVFLGPLNDRQQQVGDAVPPHLARAVAVSVLEADRATQRTSSRLSTSGR